MTEKSKGLSWGIGIWLLYGGFVLFILIIVGFASLQSFDLVEQDYYERGIAYQGQIDKVARTNALPEQPKVLLNESDKSVTVVFPASFATDGVTGTVALYRPSNSAYDRQSPLKLQSNHTCSISMADLPSGLWKVKLDWQYADQSYFNEEIVIVE